MRRGSTWAGGGTARGFAAWATLACVLAAAPALAQVPRVVVCEKCHADREFLVGKAATPEGEAALYVPASTLRETAHQRLACVDCHPEYGEQYPHRMTAIAAPCGSCHEREGQAWAQSSHAANVATKGDAATCVDCHTSHTVYSAEDRRSPTHALNVATLCGSCHADPRIVGTYFTAPDEGQARVAVEQYYETVHGAAMTRAGLVVSATCNDCHGAHLILPADSARSRLHPTNVDATCGACHTGVLEDFSASAHGVALGTGERTPEGDPAPSCTQCHKAHRIVRTDEPAWVLGVVEECGECHRHVYETYFETYHGKVTRLGSGLAARCADCHTAHRMLPTSNPASTIYPLNLVETCAQCHPNANFNFVQYRAHGDYRDRERYPELYWPWLFMTTLLAGVFGFFGLHTLLWLVRIGVDRIRGGAGGHGSRAASRGEEGR